MEAIENVAFAALAISLGATKDELPSLTQQAIQDGFFARSPYEAFHEMRSLIERVRD
jgi:hypothetical protein